MTFRFSLQKILELREKEKNEAQLRFQETQNNLYKLRQILEQERQNYFSQRESLNHAVSKVQFADIEVYERSLANCQLRMMEILKAVRVVQSELKERELDLMNAKLNEKKIQKLYQIKLSEYEKREKLREQNLLDEMATQNFLKNRFEEEQVGENDYES